MLLVTSVHDDLIGEKLALGCSHTLDGLAVHDDGFNGLVHPERDTEVFGDAGHAFADAAQPTHGGGKCRIHTQGKQAS